MLDGSGREPPRGSSKCAAASPEPPRTDLLSAVKNKSNRISVMKLSGLFSGARYEEATIYAVRVKHATETRLYGNSAKNVVQLMCSKWSR